MTGMARRGALEDESAPDHGDPTTWPWCIKPGCGAQVDPWDHNTRCLAHRPHDDELVVRRHVQLRAVDG